MAIENEVKYVLTGYAALETALVGVAPWEYVHQGYLNPETRIRRFVADDNQPVHIFSFKRRLPDGASVEIETEIPEREFAMLWEDCGMWLVKRRFKLADGDVHWDIDFFKGQIGTYFALAEAEMPEGMSAPGRIPAEFAAHVKFEVSRSDGRFASFKLGDEGFARSLAAWIDVVP